MIYKYNYKTIKKNIIIYNKSIRMIKYNYRIIKKNIIIYNKNIRMIKYKMKISLNKKMMKCIN